MRSHKTYFVLFLFLLLVPVLLFAMQREERVELTADSKDISPSEVTYVNPNGYTPGEDQDIRFGIFGGSPDGEWVVAVQITFPEDWVINSIDQESADWDDMRDFEDNFAEWGDTDFSWGNPYLANSEQWFEVNVNVPDTATGEQHITVDLFGDEWGEPPHEITIDLYLNELQDYAVALSQLIEGAFVEIGETYYYKLTVTNEGAMEDDYLFDTEGLWVDGLYADTDDTPIDTPLTIASGDSFDLYLKLDIPEEVAPGTENINTVEVFGTGVSDSVEFESFAIITYFEEQFLTELPDTWNIVEMGDATPVDRLWHYVPDFQYVRHLWTEGGEDADNWLITPPISIDLDAKDEGSIWLHIAEIGPDHFDSGWYEYHGIWISNGSPDPVDGDFEELYECVPLGEWTFPIIDIAPWLTGDDIYFAFVYQGNDMDAWIIDAVMVYNDGFDEPADEYEVTVLVDPDTIEGDADPQGAGDYEEGDTVDISVQTVAGYTFTGWTSVPAVTFADDSALSTTFTMPADDVTVTANYESDFPADEYEVTVLVDPDAIEADADPQGAGDYEEGDTVDISVQTVSGYIFTGWTSVPAVTFADESALSTTFTMPADDIVVTANYEIHDPDCDPIDTLPYFKAFDDYDDTPDCWQNIDQSGEGFYWEFRTRAGVDLGTDGNYAIIDSDAAGSGAGNVAADLITPVFDLTNYGNGVEISFIHYYNHLGDSSATLLYSIDNGATWEVIETWNADSGIGEEFSAVVEEVGGHSEVLFAWSYDDGDGWNWYWAVDNILIEEYIEPDEYTVTIEVDPEAIETDADPQGAGDYEEGDTVSISVQEVAGYTFTGWTSVPDVTFADESALSTTFTMPADDVIVTANYEEDDPDDGPDASISSDDITYSPSDPLPGDTVTITARVHNIGTEDITSGSAEFYYSIEPGLDLEHIDTEDFGLIESGEYLDITLDWHTDEDMDPMIYIITVMLTDIMPEDIDLDNNEAYIELALPVELAYFTAVGINNRANIRWRTLSENDNLGFNLYRLNVNSSNQVFMPEKLNDQLIPGQGTTSNPTDYTYTDHGINRFFDYIYILETVSTYGETSEYQTQLMRINPREVIFE